MTLTTNSSSSYSTFPESADTNHSNKDNQHPATMMMKENRQQEEKKDRKDRNLSLLGPPCAKVGL
jgi:hypothetical protein